MRLKKALFLALLVTTSAGAFPSKELAGLWDIPLQPVPYEVLAQYRRSGLVVEEVRYQSREYKGEPSRIFGYFCYPEGAKNSPALLISHGGGGSANLANTLTWARRGYAVLAIDLPGKGDQRWNSRSTGPDMEVPILLRTRPEPSMNYLVHAVAATRNGITFLTQREEVDPKRIGMVGLSWGGVITLLTNGQDKRLATAVNVFGAGHIPEGCTWQDRFDLKSAAELAEWNDLIDPKNFLKSQHAPILFMTGTNDHCYYLPTVQKSYEEVAVAKKLVLYPNLRHQFLPGMQAVVMNWLDNKLKDGGSFPEVKVQPLFKKQGEEKLIIPAIATATHPITEATMHYTLGEPSRWTKREWLSARGYFEDGIWYFGVPTALVRPEMMFFINVRDRRGSLASTPIRSIFRVKIHEGKMTYAMSSPIRKINVHEPPLQVMGLKRLPEIVRLWFSKQSKTYYLLFGRGAHSSTADDQLVD